MARKSIKPLLRKNMENYFPEFIYDDNSKRYLIFRNKKLRDIYNFIHFQIDYSSNGIALNSAATYNIEWEGEPAYPLGKDAGIENIKQNSRVVNALDGWYFCENNFSNLEEILIKINKDIKKYVLPYLKISTKELQEDKLLQYCLKTSNKYRINRKDFEEELRKVKYIIKDLTNPVFLSFLEDANDYCIKTKINTIDAIEKIICDIMYYGIRNENA